MLKEVIWKDLTALWSAIFLGIFLFVSFLASTTGMMIVGRGSRNSSLSSEEYIAICLVFAGICAVILAYRIVVLLRFCQNVLEVDGYVTAMVVEAGGVKHTYEYQFGPETYTKTFLRKSQYPIGTRILVFVNPSRPHKPIVAE
jgi:preprotein translocase subunit SecY